MPHLIKALGHSGSIPLVRSHALFILIELNAAEKLSERRFLTAVRLADRLNGPREAGLSFVYCSGRGAGLEKAFAKNRLFEKSRLVPSQ